ncbi:MAG: S8 family serine peptidase [Bryobacterales bacterium]|nr:S8 family serine peptidase [Bryobacterales bacterium]
MIAPPDIKDRYIISFLPGITGTERAEAARLAGAVPLVDLGLISAVSVRIPDINILTALQGLPGVVKVVPDRRIFALQTDPVKGNGGGSGLTGARNIGSFDTSETVPAGVKRVGEPTTGAEGAGVGIMIGDTGIDWAHPDLMVASDRFDAFGGSCIDMHGHGTHVAGTVAALKNDIGVVGVAPGATLYCGKVLADNGSGSDSNIIELLQWVVNKNAEGVNPRILVVNLSLGREKVDGDMDGPLREAIQAAYKTGVTIIVAAGNDASVEVKDQAPSGFPEVIAVASTTAEEGYSSGCPFIDGRIAAGTASYFTTDGAFDSETGIGVTISAPGGTRENVNLFCRISCEGILSTAVGGGTTRSVGGSAACGTSMAAPHVAGLVARMIEAGISGPEIIRTRLRANAIGQGSEPLDSPGAAYTHDGEREGIAVWRP